MINVTRFAIFDLNMSSQNSEFVIRINFWSNFNWWTWFDCPITSHTSNTFFLLKFIFQKKLRLIVGYRFFVLCLVYYNNRFCMHARLSTLTTIVVESWCYCALTDVLTIILKMCYEIFTFTVLQKRHITNRSQANTKRVEIFKMMTYQQIGIQRFAGVIALVSVQT